MLLNMPSRIVRASARAIEGRVPQWQLLSGQPRLACGSCENRDSDPHSFTVPQE